MPVVQPGGASTGFELLQKRREGEKTETETQRERKKGINLARSQIGAWSPNAESSVGHIEGPTMCASCGGGGGERGRAASELMGVGLQSGCRGYMTDFFFFLFTGLRGLAESL